VKLRAQDAQLLEEMNAAFERLNKDLGERHRYDAELREWDATLLDGLEQEEEALSDESTSADA
jgi:hypothetical protein